MITMLKFMFFTRRCWIIPVLIILCFSPMSAAAKLVIAQGGASGYLMRNSLPSMALAVAMDSSIVKIDAVLTFDNEVIGLTSPNISKTTNVAEIFPDRIRVDGSYYALDFTLDEIRLLTFRNPADHSPQELQPDLRIPTLAETLSLIVALDRSLEKNSSIAVEIKQVWFHRKEGKDISRPVLTVLQKYGYTGQTGRTFLMSHDEAELKRINKELLPEMGMNIKLVQLIESNEGQESMLAEWGEWHSYNYDWMFFKSGLRTLSETVTTIGLPKHLLADSKGKLLRPDFVKNAHKLGIMIFTFPVEKDEGGRLPFVHSFDEELEFLYFTAEVDGVFTAYCRDALLYLKKRVLEPAAPLSTDNEVGDPLQLTIPLTHNSTKE